MNDKEIKGFISKGHILCRIIFEMAGNPKEHVENTLKGYIKTIKEDPDYIFMEEYYAPAEENEGVWSTFFESKVLVTNFEKLNVLCFNLGPASVEILQPEEMTLNDKRLTEIYNDFISKIHEVGIAMKNLAGENDLLKVNLNRSIRNCVFLALNEPRSIEDISEKTGIDAEHLQPFIDAMLKEKSLVKDGEKYYKKAK
ncbi:MAG: hypothetical protein ACP5NW_04325 [Candidatus Woesearchaeota archaeon]